MGTILVVTAAAGSLGAIIVGTGMQEVLADLLDANPALPLVTVWGIAAVFRMAIGGQTVAGLTAIGIIAPLIADLGLSPILVVLAAGLVAASAASSVTTCSGCSGVCAGCPPGAR
uniref:GntT/GntP/DsdX family permease n=1 Tax=Agrococcus sp. KRD186 TaxID=2729730 RepID=UPI0019D03258